MCDINLTTCHRCSTMFEDRRKTVVYCEDCDFMTQLCPGCLDFIGDTLDGSGYLETHDSPVCDRCGKPECCEGGEAGYHAYYSNSDGTLSLEDGDELMRCCDDCLTDVHIEVEESECRRLLGRVPEDDTEPEDEFAREAEARADAMEEDCNRYSDAVNACIALTEAVTSVEIVSIRSILLHAKREAVK